MNNAFIQSTKIGSFLLVIFTSLLYAGFGNAPTGWGDIRFGLVSNGVPSDPDTKRLKTAVDDLKIKIDYRYRYVTEGVDPTKNSCATLFPWKFDSDYSKYAKRDAGVEASYVIYVLQEEGGRVKLLQNINDATKMQQFLHTLRIVAERANGHKATIIVEPDTWGYLLQDRYQATENTSVEIDPTKITAQVNNLKSFMTYDSSYNIPDPSKPWEKEIVSKEKPISFDYLSDLPNNLSGLARGIVRTLHKYAPDCYVGFVASHWSVRLNLGGNGWNDDGLVWSKTALIDTSAKININFFKKLYYGSIDVAHPLKQGDSPDFIGVEKNGLCAGAWEKNSNRMNWYWGDAQMKNYLTWVKQIAQGIDLPVLGWQISIGNMNNPNTADEANIANAYKDNFFPYFFTHVKDFLDAGFIGFLAGKGLANSTDFTLPGETVGEKGWFMSQLKEFDKGRPWLKTVVDTQKADVFPPSFSHPGTLPVDSIPQFICFGFDDNMYTDGMRWVDSLLNTRKNPDGFPARATFYVRTHPEIKNQKLWNMIDTVYSHGNEIGNHSRSHNDSVINANINSVSFWDGEIGGANTDLQNQSAIPVSSIRGFRAPFLNLSASAVQAIANNKMLYDCSIEHGMGQFADTKNNNYVANVWPYTLENGKHSSGYGGPSVKVRGVWELPIYELIPSTGWINVSGNDYTLWSRKKFLKQNVLDLWKSSVKVRMEGDSARSMYANRCPLFIEANSDLYTDEHPKDSSIVESTANRRAAIAEFIDWAIKSNPAVRIVPMSEVIKWMKNPVPYSQYHYAPYPDTEKPVITGMPSNISVILSAGKSDTTISWVAPTASDNIGVTSFTTDHAINSVFTAGVTKVKYTAKDASGNSATDSFTVTVTKAVGTVEPTLSFAAVYDENGDGKADFAGVKFKLGSAANRYTVKDVTAKQESWPAAANFNSMRSFVVVGDDSCRFVPSYTAGAGSGRVQFTFSGISNVSGELVDRVGPAVGSATLNQLDLSRACDTLKVVSSEPLSTLAKLDWAYLCFKKSKGELTTINSMKTEISGDTLLFFFPKNSIGGQDSVKFIWDSGISDAVGNTPAVNTIFAAIRIIKSNVPVGAVDTSMTVDEGNNYTTSTEKVDTLDLAKIVTDPNSGAMTVSVTSASVGTVAVIPGTMKITYKHNDSEVFVDQFTYSVSNGLFATDAKKVAVEIVKKNDNRITATSNILPVVAKGTNTTDLAQNNTVDSDVGTVLKYSIQRAGFFGTAIVDQTGKLTYVHDKKNLEITAAIFDTVVVSISDLVNYDSVEHLVSDTVFVTINPKSVNEHAPVILTETFDVIEGKNSSVINLRTLVSDLDGTTDAAMVSIVGTLGTAVQTGDLVTYTHNGSEPAVLNGTFDTLCVTATDGKFSTDGMIFLRILNQNDSKAIGTDDMFSVNENALLTVPTATGVLKNDSDGDLPAANNILTAKIATAAKYGTVVLAKDGSFTYQSNGKGIEQTDDQFTYTVEDSSTYDTTVHVSAPITVSINVVNVNDEAPVGVADRIVIGTGQTFSSESILTNDSDIDPKTVLSAVLVDSTKHGVLALNSNGTFQYTHDGSSTFADTFSYKANDGIYLSGITRVIVSIVPPTKYDLTVSGGTGSGSYLVSTQVGITATVPSGKEFVKWNSSVSEIIADIHAQSTQVTMPASSATITAEFQTATVSTYPLNVVNGTGSGSFTSGTKIEISAQVPVGKEFVKWSSAVPGILADSLSSITKVTMPSAATTVTAMFQIVTDKKYDLTIIGGLGSGVFTAGTQVDITATIPAGKVFDHWSSTVKGVLSDSISLSTKVKMPAEAVVVTAIYKSVLIPADFNGDKTVDVLDFAKVAEFWNTFAKGETGFTELAPDTGTFEAPAVKPDNKFDYKDLNRFVQYCYYFDGKSSGGSIIQNSRSSESVPAKVKAVRKDGTLLITVEASNAEEVSAIACRLVNNDESAKWNEGSFLSQNAKSLALRGKSGLAMARLSEKNATVNGSGVVATAELVTDVSKVAVEMVFVDSKGQTRSGVVECSVTEDVNTGVKLMLAPNPFTIEQPINLMLIAEKDPIISAEAMIYDAVGNRVFHKTETAKDFNVTFHWDGTRNSGGSFQAIVKYSTASGKSGILKEMIGLRR